ncbi:MAG: hypothetical protein WCT41_01195 [Candidatus Paceibacterota bacterium]|jgi:hypothetical protein
MNSSISPKKLRHAINQYFDQTPATEVVRRAEELKPQEMKSREMVLFGPPGLVAKVYKTFKIDCDGNVIFDGIRIAGLSIKLPKGRINDIHCRLRLHHPETGDLFETTGYVSDAFVYEVLQCWDGKDTVTIAGKKMVHQPVRGNSVPQQYYLLVEVIEDTSPF